MKRFVRGEILTAEQMNELLDKVNGAQLCGEPIHPESPVTSPALEAVMLYAALILALLFGGVLL